MRPLDATAQRKVIGCAIFDPGCIAGLDLQPDEFLDPQCAKSWEGIQKLRTVGDPVTSTAVGMTMNSTALAAFAAIMGAEVPTAENVAYYARQVRQQSIESQARLAVDKILADPELSGAELVAKLQHSLAGIDVRAANEGRLVRTGMLDTLSGLEKRSRSGDSLSGISTGLGSLDSLLGGLQRGVPTVVGARPSVGKSSLTALCARLAAPCSTTIDYYSLEDTERSLHMRWISQSSGVDLEKVASAQLDADEWRRVSDAAGDLAGGAGSILVCHEMPNSFARLAAVIERNASKRQTDLVVVDYFQLLRDPAASRGRSRADELGQISARLCSLARQYNFALLIAAQINRDGEESSPGLRHLKDCGALEQDAYAAILLERKKVVDHGDELPVILAHVRKNKNGRTGTVILRWNAPTVTFSDCDPVLLDRARKALSANPKR